MLQNRVQSQKKFTYLNTLLDKVDLLIAFQEKIKRLKKSYNTTIKKDLQKKIKAELYQTRLDKREILESISTTVLYNDAVKERLKSQDVKVRSKDKERGKNVLEQFVSKLENEESLQTLQRRLRQEADHESVAQLEVYYSQKTYSRVMSYSVNAIALLTIFTIAVYRTWKN